LQSGFAKNDYKSQNSNPIVGLGLDALGKTLVSVFEDGNIDVMNLFFN
jgi:hypothetical protein